MSTYTLHPTAIVHGRGKSSSYLSNNWINLYNKQPTQLKAGMAGDRVQDYYAPDMMIWDEMHCLNFMFDQATLNLLRTKNITSVTFKTKVTGTLKANNSDLRHQIRYKYSSGSGEGTNETSGYWQSASSADATEVGQAVAGRIGSSTASNQDVTNQEITVTLANSIPKNGYVIGPATCVAYGAYGLLTFSSTLSDTTLTVVTDEVDDYTVTYSANGGEGAPPVQTYRAGSSVTLSSVTPTRTGYRFLGWSQSSTASTANYAAGSTQTFNANVTLYAVWTRQTYTISFDANGGSNPPAAQTKTYGVDLTLTSSVPTREGYEFVGWARSNTATTADYASGATYTENGNATLYAVWSLITADHTLSYNANGGTGAPASETRTYSVTAPTFFTVSSTQPSRTGYTFKGWASAAGSSTVEYSAGDSIPASSDKTLYAVWQINTYPVNYNANGGVGAPASQTKTYGVALALSSVVPTRDGYTFLGWAESADATEAEYAPGASYTKNQAKTLYAVWQIKTYTIHFDAAGGSAAPADQTKVHGETLVLSSYIPRLQGYRFRGWGLAPNAQTVAYEPGCDYTANAPVTLYALWRRSMYAGVYVVRDGKPIPSDVYL